jgi:beta-phosphoglucomutase
MPIRSIIFDMDGVLVDAKEWHYIALNRALSLFGHEIDLHAHETRFDGLPTKTKLEMLSSERHLPRGLHRFINQLKQQYTAQLIDERLVPNATHVNALSRLRVDGLVLALASNSIRATIDHMMELAKLRKYLEFCLSNEDVRNPKPSPQIYLKAMNQAGISPSECLILEDSPFGLKAARDSGAHVMKIDSVNDVNYDNIRRTIAEIESTESKSVLYCRRAA